MFFFSQLTNAIENAYRQSADEGPLGLQLVHTDRETGSSGRTQSHLLKTLEVPAGTYAYSSDAESFRTCGEDTCSDSADEFADSVDNLAADCNAKAYLGMKYLDTKF